MSRGARLAVVGSRRLPGHMAEEIAWTIVDYVITRCEPEVVISGGATGVDAMARHVAARHGYTTEGGGFVEHLPKHRRWHPDGFKARNEDIAQDCTHLLCVRAAKSATFGAGWTARRARELGRVVWEVVVA